MPWNKVVGQPSSRWMGEGGTHADVVLSSRIRLARNLDGVPFPHRLDARRAEAVVKQVEAGIKEINLLGFGSKVELYPLAQASGRERQVLVEKHLISPHLAQAAQGRAVAISEDEGVSIMVNEEDHLRIQVLLPGQQLTQAWDMASKVDDALEQKVAFAFHQQRGYLTACPTNLGTGLRASVMVHLPGLVLTGKASDLLTALGQSRLVVRGLYGEGSDALGNLFQISNQLSLGHSEEEIIHHLDQVTNQVVEHEHRAREALYRELKEQLDDRLFRSYGLLSQARIMTGDEAMRLLSDVRLGVDLGLFPSVKVQALNELLVATRPAFLQHEAGHELSPRERDMRRAALIRGRLVA